MDGNAVLVGLSRANATLGLTATSEHDLPERGFDIVAALFGAADAAPGKLPDAALALLVHGIILDFIACRLPGPGCDVLEERIRFVADPAVGDRVVVSGRIAARPSAETATVAITLQCGRGLLAEGAVEVRLPMEAVSLRPEARPDIILHRHRHLERLMSRAAAAPPLSAAIAWPCDRDSLLGPWQAMQAGGFRPILVGPRDAMEKAAAEAGITLDGCEVVEAATPAEAAATAVRLCRDGAAQALMKGSLHTDELMAAVVARDAGLRGARRISQVFAMDVPSYPKPLFVTDAAINIAPDLLTKADIVQNAVDMLHALGNPLPKVAIL